MVVKNILRKVNSKGKGVELGAYLRSSRKPGSWRAVGGGYEVSQVAGIGGRGREPHLGP